MANLLLHIESFAWQDLTLNRAIEMDDLILAVAKADELEDTIYGHPDAYNPHLGWGTINDLLTYSEEEYSVFTKGWFTHNHQKILIKLWRNATPGAARNLEELENEPDFKSTNNGLLGCLFQPLPHRMVYDETSLEKLHRDYVSQNPDLRKTHPSYFYRHYRPTLRISSNSINVLIRRQQTHTCFLRIDEPTIGHDGQPLHGEKTQMHFNDPNLSCLNIDGNWKHGGFDIPQVAKTQLEDWGFILPLNQR
ncbi:MAG: hypothetical protein ABIQ93_08095 [Saprospiraceae bacterium]